MKFGVEFDARSVSRWKNYNIDYNLLKSLIREVTTDFDDNSSSDNSYSSLNDSQKKLLKTLFKNFKDQIDFVSLFVFSKVGEISRRLTSLKRQCNLFIQNDDNIDPSDTLRMRMRKKKLLVFHKELDSITKELQDLSRFILLQKIAIKKLLKKYMKYSSFAKKQNFIDKITEKCLMENPKSFIHLSLDDLSLETTLLYDFLATFLNKSQLSKDFDQTIRNRQSSIRTIDSLQLTANSYNTSNNFDKSSTASDSNESQVFPRSTTFDIVSKRKGPRCLTFWVHRDNLDEIKFLLSSEFKLVTDTSLFSEETSKLKNTRSNLNLRGVSEGDEIMKRKPNSIAKDDFCPETDTVMIWLNDPRNLKFVQTTNLNNLDFEIDTHNLTDKLNTFIASPYSQILVSNVNLLNDNNPILMTPVGGLRQFSIATLNKSLVDSLFCDLENPITNDEKKLELFNSWKASNLKGNTQMTQLGFDWVIDNNVKPLANVSSKKLRYINLNENDKIDFYISLDWDIRIHNSNIDGSENSDLKTFPHAILEINFNLPQKEFPSNIQNLINSYLVYRVDNLNFSLNNYLIYLYINEFNNSSINDDEMLLFIAPWHNLLDKDIRSLPEIRAKSQANIDSQNLDFDASNYNNNANDTNVSPDGILLNKDDTIPTKPGYWNEFDNGSDYGGDDGGFYVYNDDIHNSNSGLISWFSNLFFGMKDSNSDFEDSEINLNNYNAGLNWLSQKPALKILFLSNCILDFCDSFKNKVFGTRSIQRSTAENRLLLCKNARNYSFGAISENYNADHEDDESDSDSETISSIAHRKDLFNLLSKENYDNCLSFLYLSIIMLSLITSSIGSVIILTVFTNDRKLGKPGLTKGLLALVIFAISCLVLSILLAGFSICFLLFRNSNAPTWHYFFVWIGAILSSVFFLYGITNSV